jgi:hypothetical protein
MSQVYPVFIHLMKHIKNGLQNPRLTGFDKKNLISMSEKIDEYWPLIADNSLIPMILDPRYKLDIIDSKNKKNAKAIFNDAFLQYQETTKDSQNIVAVASTSSRSSNVKNGSQSLIKKIKEKLVPLSSRFFVDQSYKEVEKAELQIYFSESRSSNGEEDVLNWWKINQSRFPTLAKMARDYLAMQGSSVPSERGFSQSGLTVTNLRNRLHPETVRCAMCLKSWLKLNIS